MISKNYIPQITLPTRVTQSSATLIDNIFTKTNHSNPVKSGIITTVISDHYPTFTIIPLKTNKSKTPKIVFKRKFTHNNINAFIDDLSNEQWSEIYKNEPNSVNTKWNNFIQKYKELFEKNIPIKRIKFNKYKHKLVPWLTSGILTSIKTRDKLHYKITKELNQNKRIKLMTRYRTHQHILKKIINIYKNKYWKVKFEETKSDSKTTWKLINQLINKPKNTSKYPDSFNLSLNNNIANEFNMYFSSIGKTLASKLPLSNNTSHPKSTNKSVQSIFMKPVDNLEILSIVKNMKNKASSGPDEISSKLLKSTILHILDPITHIINESLLYGTVPDAMKVAKVIPVYKNNDVEQLSNYRPISNAINIF